MTTLLRAYPDPWYGALIHHHQRVINPNRRYEVKEVSLKDRILAAKSVDEINALLQEGDRYEFAAPSTRRKWDVAAAEHRKALERAEVKARRKAKREAEEQSS